MKNTLLLVAAWMSLSIVCSAQVKDALDQLSLYKTESEMGRPSYLVVQSVYTANPGDSPTLLDAEARIVTFKHKKMLYGSFELNPTFYDGAPEYEKIKIQGKETLSLPPTGPLSTRDSEYEHLDLDGEMFTLQREGSELSFVPRNPEVMHGTALKPFSPMHWPIANYLYLSRSAIFAKDIFDIIDGMECKKASFANGVLDGEWLTKTKPGGMGGYRCEISFKDDLVVESKWQMFYHPSKEEPKGLVFNLATVKTKWDESRSDPVPVEVEMVADAMNKLIGICTTQVKLKWYFPGDKEFDEFAVKVTETADAIRKKYAKRNIAGAE